MGVICKVLIKQGTFGKNGFNDQMCLFWEEMVMFGGFSATKCLYCFLYEKIYFWWCVFLFNNTAMYLLGILWKLCVKGVHVAKPRYCLISNWIIVTVMVLPQS